MRKTVLATLIAALFAAPAAFAQSDEQPFRLTGEVSAGPIYNNTNAQDKAKLQEYQDLGNGALSNISIFGRGGDNYWLDAYGENFGRDDQYIALRGGQYDVFKYGAWFNSMPHNFSTSARTPYVGVGSGILTTTFPQLNTDNWSTFTLGYKRTDNGGYLEWQHNNPWYFRVDGNQVKFDGTKVGSAANGTSPGNGSVDLAIPTQYTTNNIGAEAGYQSRTLTLALRYDYSKFDNAIDTLNWTNPFFNNRLDTTYLPADNSLNRVSVTGNYRDLPWHGVLAARYSYSTTESDVGLATTAVNGNVPGSSDLTGPSTDSFHGKKVNQLFAFTWTASPLNTLDTRFYYYWTKLENNSTQVEFTGPVGAADNDLFDYRKNNVGIDAWWKFTKGQRLGGGYDYVNLNQNRVDYDHMNQDTLWVEYKLTAIEDLVGRIKYEHVDRRSHSLYSDSGTDGSDPNYLLRFVSAFDMQNMNSDRLRFDLDWSPAPMWNVDFEAIAKNNDYNNVTLGRTKDKRQEYDVTLSYGDPNTARWSLFGDYEKVEYPSNHRYIGSVPCNAASGLLCNDPSQPPFTNAYNWNSGTRDENWTIGVALDWPINPQWLVKASYMYFQTNGSADFAVQDNGVTIPSVVYPVPITQFDDTKHHMFNLKGLYAWNKNWTFTLGYAYEKWTYNDVSYNGYQNFAVYPPVASNTSLAYLNGYNAFTNGSQNIFYGLASFRF